MKILFLGLVLAIFGLSNDALASDNTRDTVYDACLKVETKNAADDGQTDPELAAHYLCTIVADDCAERPEGQQCRKAQRRYGLAQ